MANIKEYSAEATLSEPITTRQARPIDTGDIGSSISRFGGSTGELGQAIEKRQEAAELSSMSSELAATHAQLAGQLDDSLQNYDPTDTDARQNFTQNFMDQYDAQVGKVGDNVSTPAGQKYFAKANAEMRSQFLMSAMRGKAQLDGKSAVDNLQSTTDSLSTTLFRDPSQIDGAVQQHSDLIDSLPISDVAKDELRDKGEKQLAKAEFDGISNIDPLHAQKLVKDGYWDDVFNANELDALGKVAKVNVQAQDVEQNRIEKKQQDLFSAQQEATRDVFLSKLDSGDLSATDVLKSNLDAFGSGSKKEFLGMIKANTETKIKTDPDAFISAFQKIHLPDGDPQKITNPDVLNQMVVNRQLDIPGLQQLRAEVAGAKTPEGAIDSQLKTNFLSIAKQQSMTPDSYQAFLAKFLPTYDAKIKAGGKAEDLLNPASPNYMGKMIVPFYKSPQQVIDDRNAQLVLPAPPSVSATYVAPGFSPSPAQVAPGQATKSATQPQTGSQTPKTGDTVKGYKFLGGNPADKNSWKKAQ